MKESFFQTKVRYTLQIQEKLFVFENVPARIFKETGDQYFAPETVEHLQALVEGNIKPIKVIETPIYDYAAA